jgi:hypothetical protein
MEQQMTRAERKAIQARVAVATLAQLAAKKIVKAQIRAAGERVWDFTAKEITLRAVALLEAHPEMYAEARERAVELGFAPRQSEEEIAK